MFTWLVGDSCKGACGESDPATDTVKFISAPVTQDEEEGRQERLKIEQERKRAEDAERQGQERIRLEKERLDRERLERERREQEEIREQEAERARLEERRREEEAARKEADRVERARVEALERTRQEEAAAQQRLQDWLQKNGFGEVNAKKSKMLMARYPLHDAVSQKDSEMVKLLLRFGADGSLKNSTGKTAQQLAQKQKGCDEVLAAFSSQTQMKRGGA